jgi:hypothetical protein
MAQQEELVIVIKTETVDLVKGLATAKNGLDEFGKDGAFSINELNKALKALAKEAEKTSDPLRKADLGQKYQELSAKIAELRRQWQSYNGTVRETGTVQVQANAQIDNSSRSIDGISESTRRARIAVFGLNNVVRDLPFGFIAISNNLPILVDQFVELRKESNGTLPALRNFAKSLIGIGGFSIAISAGISLITTAVQKYGSLGAAFNELTGSISNAERTQRDYNKAVADGQKDLSIQLSNLDRLVSLSNNATIGLENQRQASVILRQEIDKIVVSQRDQKDSIEGVSGELLDYAKRVVIARVNLKAFETVIGDVGVELAKTAAEGVTFGDLFVGAIQKINLFTEALIRGDFQLAKSIAQLDFTSIATKNLEKRIKDLEDRQKRATQAADKFAEAQIKSGIATADLYNQQLNDQKKLAEEQRAAEQERQRLARLAAREQIKQNKELQRAATLQERQRIEFALFRELLDKPISIILPESNVNQIIEDIRKARIELQGFKKEARPNQQNVFDISVPQTEGVKASIESINRLLGVFREQQGAAFGDFQERAQVVANLFNATLGPAIDNVFSAIENGENIFQAIGDSLKRLVIDLVKTIAKAAILAAILSALSGGGFSFATFGAFFKQILSAGGALGTNRGPLSDVLSGGRQIAAPNIGGPGGFALAGQVVFVQRGTDLVGVLDRSNSRIGRVG